MIYFSDLGKDIEKEFDNFLFFFIRSRTLRYRIIKKLILEDRHKNVEAFGKKAVKILRDLGSDLLGLGNVKGSIDCRIIAHKLDPDSDVIGRELLRSLYHAGKFQDALKLARGVNFSIPNVSRVDLEPIEKLIFSVVGDLAIASLEMIVAQHRCIQYLQKAKIEGAFVECGVFKGGGVMAMLMSLNHLEGITREIYMYDTFEGNPLPDDIDVYTNGIPAIEDFIKYQRADGGSGWVYSPLDEVKYYVSQVPYDKDLLRYVKGLVEETIPAHIPEKIALLRLDTNFYSSTKHELEHLFPRLEHGGIIFFDDYGAYLGSQKATDEYFESMGIIPMLFRVDNNVRVYIKL